MSAINVYFDGIPGNDPIKYLGVFDDAGEPLNREEWREIGPGKWALRVVCIEEHQGYWDETGSQKAMRIFRMQAPGMSLTNKLRNVLQSMRNNSGIF